MERDRGFKDRLDDKKGSLYHYFRNAENGELRIDYRKDVQKELKIAFAREIVRFKVMKELEKVKGMDLYLPEEDFFKEHIFSLARLMFEDEDFADFEVIYREIDKRYRKLLIRLNILAETESVEVDHHSLNFSDKEFVGFMRDLTDRERKLVESENVEGLIIERLNSIFGSIDGSIENLEAPVGLWFWKREYIKYAILVFGSIVAAEILDHSKSTMILVFGLNLFLIFLLVLKQGSNEGILLNELRRVFKVLESSSSKGYRVSREVQVAAKNVSRLIQSKWFLEFTDIDFDDPDNLVYENYLVNIEDLKASFSKLAVDVVVDKDLSLEDGEVLGFEVDVRSRLEEDMRGDNENNVEEEVEVEKEESVYK